ncbi:MAG: hypothetical protein ACYDFU_02585 [Nitrospirota bacterium]
MKKYLKIFIIISSAILLVSACAKKQVVKPSAESVKATRALSAFAKMEAAYKARDLDGTLKDVSRDFKKSYADFASIIRKDMDIYPKVDLAVNMDRVVESGNQVMLVFHWSGTWTDKKGGSHMARGNCTYIYRDTGSSIILVDFIGDSPFGVAR